MDPDRLVNPNAIENAEDDDASEPTSDNNNVQDEDEDDADSGAAEAAGDLVAGLGECILKGKVFFIHVTFYSLFYPLLHFYFFSRPVRDQR